MTNQEIINQHTFTPTLHTFNYAHNVIIFAFVGLHPIYMCPFILIPWLKSLCNFFCLEIGKDIITWPTHPTRRMLSRPSLWEALHILRGKKEKRQLNCPYCLLSSLSNWLVLIACWHYLHTLAPSPHNATNNSFKKQGKSTQFAFPFLWSRFFPNNTTL